MQTRWLAEVLDIALAGMLTLLVLVPMSVQDANAGIQTLVGTWSLELTSIDCDTGDPLGSTTNRALHTYLPSGSLVGSTNITAFRSPSYGIWKRTDRQPFLAIFTNFSFNAADGTPTGRAEVTERITPGADPHHFTATAEVKVFNVNDIFLFTICVDETAERLTFDQ